MHFPHSFKEFEPSLTIAEKNLVNVVSTGRPLALPGRSHAELHGIAKSNAMSSIEIRGEFLRFLVLGGDKDCLVHESGVDASYVYLSSNLDLRGCSNIRNFRLAKSVVNGFLLLDFAKTGSISLDGTEIFGICGNRVTVDGSIYCRHGFVSLRRTDISGCRISGSFACRGGQFKVGNQDPEKRERNIHEKPKFYSLRIEDGSIAGTLQLGPRHQRDYDDSAKQNKTKLESNISLKGTNCTAFIDHSETYESLTDRNKDELNIDGLTYQRIEGCNPFDVEFRTGWLRQQSCANALNFRPQPYEQLAKVFREMGHEDEARKILLAKHTRFDKAIFARLASRFRFSRNSERKLAANEIECPPSYSTTIKLFFFLLWRLLARYFVGYGYAPWRAIFWSAVPVICGMLIFGLAYVQGGLSPANPIISARPEWIKCREMAIAAPRVEIQSFLDDGFMSQFDALFDREQLDNCLKGRTVVSGGLPEYPTFNSFWYSLDTFIPIVGLHQEEFWLPNDTSPTAKLYLHFHITLGWLFVTLGLAGIVGLVNRRAAPGGK